jgi:hypothetical protein
MDLFDGTPPHYPLLGDEIRLLVLLPGNSDDSIRYQLKHIPLSAGHDYITLLYA